MSSALDIFEVYAAATHPGGMREYLPAGFRYFRARGRAPRREPPKGRGQAWRGQAFADQKGRVFRTTREAAKVFGVSACTIYKWLTGKRSSPAGVRLRYVGNHLARLVDEVRQHEQAAG